MMSFSQTWSESGADIGGTASIKYISFELLNNQQGVPPAVSFMGQYPWNTTDD